VDLSLPGLIFGWPVLPHGGGSYFNTFGRYINTVPTRGRGNSYGEYLPGLATGLTGEILACAINYQNNSGTSPRAYMANYGPSAFSVITLGPIGLGSSSLEVSRAVGAGIPIVPGDYIGIFVEDIAGGFTPAPTIMIEGTIYYSLK